MDVISVDVGHSAVKFSSELGNDVLKLVIPTFVCPAFRLSDENAQIKAERDTLIYQDKPYFVGETALIQGQMKNPVGRFDNWINSHEYAVLMLAALGQLARRGVNTTNCVLVLGLPSSIFARQKEQLKVLANTLVQTKHTIVMPQSVGPYQLLMLDESGFPVPKRNAASEIWGVVDVGYFTTDFLLVREGQIIEDTLGSCAGMFKAAEHLVRTQSTRGFSVDIQEAESMLISRSLKNFGERIDVGADVDQALSKIVAEVLDTMDRLLSAYARKLDGLVLAGGGAKLLCPFLQKEYPMTILPENPRFAVVEGMRRFGLAFRRLKAHEPA
ncbi:MAG: ParM/StbA family protein [Betaproteobacteria bacterium]|nr:ParM/StbA family protein [Betaproteobacteria bacterium]